jgi:hypothetical protein
MPDALSSPSFSPAHDKIQGERPMPNGVHAIAHLRLVEPTPIEAPAPAEIERSIGEATADAVAVIGAGIESGQATGGLTAAIRSLAGERLGRVAMLQLEHPDGDADFVAIVRSEGKRVLWERCGAGFRAHYGAAFDKAAIDRALDTNISWVLEIAGNAVRIERAIQRSYQ